MKWRKSIVKCKVKLLEIAANDFREICEYKSKFYKGTTLKFIEEFKKRLDIISENPNIYPKYTFDNKYRKCVIMDYLVFYKVHEESNTVSIYRIINGKREIADIKNSIQSEKWIKNSKLFKIWLTNTLKE